MQHLGIIMDIDVRTIISTVLLEQTQAVDSSGEKTMTTYYSAWYREVLLRTVTEGNLLRGYCLLVL
jgi:NCK-associated protein 1